MTAVYVLIVLVATTVGSCAGIGGGIIIKPCMDLVQADPLMVISFYSTSAVFAMACLSSVRRLLKDKQFNYLLVVLISVSSVLGGFCGSQVMKFLTVFADETVVRKTQAFMLCLMLVLLSLYYVKTPVSLRLQSHTIIFLVGFCLGLLSSFLSIGGGPANVAVFGYLFGFPLKICVTYSLTTIFFCQGAVLAGIMFTEGFSSYPCETLLFIIPAALCGSLVGSYLYRSMKDNQIRMLLVVTMGAVIAINVVNMVV
ncbi:MAG: sulfite exporter TauE/SafE family protein [Succinivibrio sp.]|nr:sulfite exporter TauE/SafE family protein [Succinivibrio sp.]